MTDCAFEDFPLPLIVVVRHDDDDLFVVSFTACNAPESIEMLEPQPQARKHTYHKAYTNMRMAMKQETSERCAREAENFE